MLSNAVKFSAVKCGVLQCSEVQCTEVQSSAMQGSALHCSVVQCSAVGFSAPGVYWESGRVSVDACSVLQVTALPWCRLPTLDFTTIISCSVLSSDT